MTDSEPIHDLAHLGHVEMFTPRLDESVRFFVDIMGMTVSGERGESVYLRGWDDYERYSLKLTASNTSGMEHMALRARSPRLWPLPRRTRPRPKPGSQDGRFPTGSRSLRRHRSRRRWSAMSASCAGRSLRR